MIQQGFYVGKERKWYVMCTYDLRKERDFEELHKTLAKFHFHTDAIAEVEKTLRKPNTGFTYTDFEDGVTFVFVSHSTSAEQMYDTIQHELKHITEHISEYWRIDARSEEAAYLQGTIAKKMFPAVVAAVCPCCNSNSNNSNKGEWKKF